MILAAVAVLPWVALAVFLAVGVREPRPLPTPGVRPHRDMPEPGDRGHVTGRAGRPEGDHAGPLVSIIVPARNEARNIRACLKSLTRLEGVRHEVVVVDDRSTDDTAAIARSIAPGRAEALRVVDGAALGRGWFGKPWACHQGARVAGGEVLLFTDADTVHEPDLLARALRALEEDGADALSLMGRQLLGSFAERLAQPQVFLLLGMRFRRLDRVLDRHRWRAAIANGQYILLPLEVYREIGGHETVRGEVVEDLRLAQELTRAGKRLTIRSAPDALSTRMYTSLGEVVEGWTKNMAVGARQAAGWWGGGAIPAILAFLVTAWLFPPVVLVAAGVGVGLEWLADDAGLAWAGRLGEHAAGLTGLALPVVVWAAGATLVAGAIWAAAYRRFEVPARYALLYPAGAAVVVWIALRSWLRGSRRIEWKGRRYGRGEG